MTQVFNVGLTKLYCKWQQSYLFVVTVRQTEMHGSRVAVECLPKSPELVQSPDRLLAERLTRESSNSWKMGKEGREEK